MSAAREVLVLALAWIGAAFALVAAIGIVRMPDLLTRLQASSKAPAVSIALLAAAAALRLGDAASAARAAALVLLVLGTTPIATHLIARAGFVTRGAPAPGPRGERGPG